ncbi:MAG TPA: putative toxin-antitoxin system toxin component, PIN family, partial [Thermodesulfobacteriota bacterium]|nr:putative toxin-antitoxin system toxin component, PIN family [Thermodesulfobacteriota bacterium]
FGGKPRKIIDLWRAGRLLLCLSKEIIDEYFEVLKRLGLEDEEELAELLALFSRGFNIAFTAKTPKIEVVNDPDDNKFVECAVALKADVIITGDKALEAVGEYMGIEILTPAEFLRRIDNKQG